jgi:hypothetical protein
MVNNVHPEVNNVHLDGEQRAPEVVNRTSAGRSEGEVVPSFPGEDERMSEERIPKPHLVTSGRTTEKRQPVKVDGQNATVKTGDTKPVTPAGSAKQVTPVQTPPAVTQKHDRLLSDHYWEMLGSPRPHADALAVRWPDAFAKLLKDYSYADLRAAIDWAFLTDAFWPKHLFRRSGDPVEYFRSKADAIIASWRSYATQQANANRKQVDAVPAKSSISKMFKIE